MSALPSQCGGVYQFIRLPKWLGSSPSPLLGVLLMRTASSVSLHWLLIWWSSDSAGGGGQQIAQSCCHSRGCWWRLGRKQKGSETRVCVTQRDLKWWLVIQKSPLICKKKKYQSVVLIFLWNLPDFTDIQVKQKLSFEQSTFSTCSYINISYFI